MLLRSNTRIIEKVLIDLFFDDESEKHIEVAEKDIVLVSYNDSGFRRDIEGRVTKIVSKPSKPPVGPMSSHICPPAGRIDMKPEFNGQGYLVIDGSGTYSGNKVIVYFSHILDCEMIEKYDENLFVKTVSNGAVNRIRVIDGVLQVSLDNGLTFVNVKDLLGKDKENLTEDTNTPDQDINKEDQPSTEEVLDGN